MKAIITLAVGLVIGVAGTVGIAVSAAAPQKYVNDIYRDSNGGVIGVFDDQTNKCYVYYGTDTGAAGAGKAGKSITCVKK